MLLVCIQLTRVHALRLRPLALHFSVCGRAARAPTPPGLVVHVVPMSQLPALKGSSSDLPPAPARNAANSLLVVDEPALAAVKAAKPWSGNPRYFTKVKVSAVAAMKMTTHASAGVDKGLQGPNRMPIEVMGMMHGHVDTEEEGCLIVNDVSVAGGGGRSWGARGAPTHPPTPRCSRCPWRARRRRSCRTTRRCTTP